MSQRTAYPNLHRLVGDSIDQLPAEIAERIEDVLSEPTDLLPNLLARMDGRDTAEGQPQKATGLTPAQAVTLASLSRTLAGLNALIQMLHAAEAARVQGSAGQQLPPDVVEGLLLAARELAQYARRQLG
ncbi:MULTISPECIES: hypothetical protein [Stenotrophomonas]|uniref:hypothetical protein n=1 Tax=Stenotrophomonas TaxID=40323 RepID=UPI000D54186D|nr:MULTISPECIES: hypothetical protein [Stenotrophomonas]AWH22515.1 hypothetical protein C1933_15490 [Stenotrophomonas sp. ZAC14D2_NAIMI4_6]AWH26370.1 hypothetical protein C1932_15345 [Stenotrophomonas sp. YAU14D1_LEIMI4_1]AWH30262.1 hypothetical protein C1931_15785 [Stenotrophomonas sp. YAU14A_MKIMI4_1]AWH34212.1 hypothetical protein C1930_15745 [Stenotrophomonas sp. SAU14A_NAIMI4_8]